MIHSIAAPAGDLKSVLNLSAASYVLSPTPPSHNRPDGDAKSECHIWQSRLIMSTPSLARTGGSYVYRVDAKDFIIYVSPEWLAFAKANEAPTLTERRVLGRRLCDFISGSETHAFYELAFTQVRLRHTEMTVPFRCDSPDTVRHMAMMIRIQPHGGLECECALLHSEKRKRWEMFSPWAERRDGVVLACSMCLRIEHEGEWVEPQEASAIYKAPPFPPLVYSVCDRCRALVGMSNGGEVRRLLLNPVRYHRCLVTLLDGDIYAAVLLSLGIDAADALGRFSLTEAQVEQMTGMRRRSQQRARVHLKKSPFWSEELRGTPARNHYRIDFARLGQALLAQKVVPE